jgi:hypothetical protein
VAPVVAPDVAPDVALAPGPELAGRDVVVGAGPDAVDVTGGRELPPGAGLWAEMPQPATRTSVVARAARLRGQLDIHHSSCKFLCSD